MARKLLEDNVVVLDSTTNSVYCNCRIDAYLVKGLTGDDVKPLEQISHAGLIDQFRRNINEYQKSEIYGSLSARQKRLIRRRAAASLRDGAKKDQHGRETWIQDYVKRLPINEVLKFICNDPNELPDILGFYPNTGKPSGHAPAKATSRIRKPR